MRIKVKYLNSHSNECLGKNMLNNKKIKQWKKIQQNSFAVWFRVQYEPKMSSTLTFTQLYITTVQRVAKRMRNTNSHKPENLFDWQCAGLVLISTSTSYNTGYYSNPCWNKHIWLSYIEINKLDHRHTRHACCTVPVSTCHCQCLSTPSNERHRHWPHQI